MRQTSILSTTSRLRQVCNRAHTPLWPWALALGLVLALVVAAHAETWRGLVVAPERRCAPYVRDDYRYPQSAKHDIIAGMDGRVYAPYTGSHFPSREETDIEHMVATSEAHDSGLCAADAPSRTVFARDLDNLTLASAHVKRYEKGGKDAADWLPELNQCWFAARIVAVKRKYALTVDAREAAALEAVLADCSSTDLVLYAPSEEPAATAANDQGSPDRRAP